MIMSMRLRRQWGLLFLMVLLVGCRSIGPKQIQLDRNRYNDAISTTHDEQLLRNIVRLRYFKQVSFLKVNSITASYTLTPTANAKGVVVNGNRLAPSDSGVAAPLGSLYGLEMEPSLTYSDQPTITYQPVGGREFVYRLLIPIQLDFLALLLNGGVHDPRLIFDVTTTSINGLDNASNASDLRTVSAPTFNGFRQLTCLLDRLMSRGEARLMGRRVAGHTAMIIRFSEAGARTQEARDIRSLLHIPQHHREIILFNGKLPFANAAQIHFRSILSTLIFLSHGVRVPKAHLLTGAAPLYYVKPQLPYDWRPLMQGIMTVHSSRRMPRHAFVKIYMYNYWYYIAGNDFSSISTFAYVNTLHILTSGDAFKGVNQTPILTIPTRG